MSNTAATQPGRKSHWHAALEAACQIVAPAWPLDRQIAVSPYWGLRNQPFAAAAATLRTLAGASLTLSRADYRNAWQSGEIAPRHLEQALGEQAIPLAPQRAVAALDEPAVHAGLPLLSDMLEVDAHGARTNAWPARVTQQISKYCAAYFDEFQADWRPQTLPGLFAGWRASVLADGGLAEPVRRRAAAMPCAVDAALDWAVERLAVPDSQVPQLLQVIVLRIGGWASWCAYLRWEAALAQTDDPHLAELLVMRLCWEGLLHDGRHDGNPTWVTWMARWSAARRHDASHAIVVDLLWQRAQEIAYQETLFTRLLAPRPARTLTSFRQTPGAQLVFCIDVRCERMRRAIESLDADARTYGFAGFFGLPIRYSPLGTTLARPQVPGLIAATAEVTDSTGDRARDAQLALSRQEALRRRGSTSAFGRLPSGAFATVEILGLASLPKLLLRALGRPLPTVEYTGLRERDRRELRPRLQADGPGSTGWAADLAATLLRTIGLTDHFGRLLVVVAHAARTANNPQAAGLACGACGGHSGEVNARLLAALLNEHEVRCALAEHGIPIPRHTVILGALHDTVTDCIELFDEECIPETHRADLEQLRATLALAGARVRSERAANLGLAHLAERDPALLKQLRRRTRDWAETRPEWGLADNAALIIAPRARTRGVDLQGRTFLHEYCSEDDPDGTVLEQILTAPLIVAHWINLQYYGSTVDPERFGSGNKVLHNVVGGRLGVLEGCAGDLRIGLSRQSVHDGSHWRHTPLRLSVVVEAPRAVIESILERHPSIRELIDNQWLYLFRLTERGVERFFSRDWRPHNTGITAAARPESTQSAPARRADEVFPMLKPDASDLSQALSR